MPDDIARAEEKCMERLKSKIQVLETSYDFDTARLEEKCERLQKQLKIAVECLEIYALENLVVVSKDGSFTMKFKNGSYSRAKQALKEIEALNEIHNQE